MVEEIAKDIYCISVPLPESPLRALNSYFIRGKDRDVLIDTGYRRPECQSSIEVDLESLQSDPARRDIFLTHLHGDHAGLSNILSSPTSRVFISEIDLQYLYRVLTGEITEKMHVRYVSEGFPELLATFIERTNPARLHGLDAVGDNYRGLKQGERIQVGDYSLQTIVVPGHTPGNTMFWIEEAQIMFTGDHVLFGITPNITAWVDVEDSLGDYMESLRKVKDYPVVTSLPGHRERGEYHTRVENLLLHHERRIEQALNIVHDMPGLTAYEIASHMTWKIRSDSWDTFPPNQKWFAVGECFSHLDYLRKRNKITREQRNGVFHYYAVSESQA